MIGCGLGYNCGNYPNCSDCTRNRSEIKKRDKYYKRDVIVYTGKSDSDATYREN
jgi:hypothetical protein